MPGLGDIVKSTGVGGILADRVQKFGNTDDTTGDQKPDEQTPEKKSSSAADFSGYLGSLIAVYLSWSCNSKEGLEAPAKILYAILASIFGWLYVVYFMIFKGKCLSTPKSTFVTAGPGMAPSGMPMAAQMFGRRYH